MQTMSAGLRQQVETFGQELQPRALLHSTEPYELRAGELSNWYVDHRLGLSSGHLLSKAAELIINLAEERKIYYEVVAGMGIAGRALATAVCMRAPGGRVGLIHANDDQEDKTLGRGYGLHGTPAADKQVLVVDDISKSGDSLVTLIKMVTEADGVVEDAVTVTERSDGLAAATLQEFGVQHHYLLEFYEQEGLLRPAV